MSESRTFARKRGIRTGAWGGKGELHSEERQVPRRREVQAKKTSVGEVGESIRGKWTQKLPSTLSDTYVYCTRVLTGAGYFCGFYGRVNLVHVTHYFCFFLLKF